MNKYPKKSKLCERCENHLYYLLKNVYANGDNELVCSNCNYGIRLNK